MEYTNEQLKAYHEKMWKVVAKVRDVIEVDVPRTHWVAPQEENRKDWVGVAAVLGDKQDYMDIYFNFEDLDTRELDDLAADAFQQMYGYGAGSEKDLQRHRDYWNHVVATLQDQRNQLENRIMDAAKKRHYAELKLKQAQKSEVKS